MIAEIIYTRNTHKSKSKTETNSRDTIYIRINLRCTLCLSKDTYRATNYMSNLVNDDNEDYIWQMEVDFHIRDIALTFHIEPCYINHRDFWMTNLVIVHGSFCVAFVYRSHNIFIRRGSGNILLHRKRDLLRKSNS